MTTQTETPIHDAVKAEHGRRAAAIPQSDPTDLHLVGSIVTAAEPADVRVFGLSWLRFGRG